MFLDPDKSLNLFSSKGKLTQCENALKAALNSSLSLGCSSADGCVLMSYKNVAPLVDRENYYKVFVVCPTIGVTYSGLQPDFRAQLEVAQKICQDYYDVYERYPYLDVFMNEYSLSVQDFSQKGGYRPFGTFLIFCGYIHEGSMPCLYQMDPSGSFRRVDIAASGKEYDQSRKFLEKRKEMLDDNIVNGLLAIKENVGNEIDHLDVSVGIFRNGLFSVYTIDQVKEIFDSLR